MSNIVPVSHYEMYSHIEFRFLLMCLGTIEFKGPDFKIIYECSDGKKFEDDFAATLHQMELDAERFPHSYHERNKSRDMFIGYFIWFATTVLGMLLGIWIS